METAVAYIRVSSQRQVEDGGSLATQEKQVLNHACSMGYALASIFREEGQSAKTDQRPELQRMLSFCKDRSNDVQVVLVPKIDRLARNVYDYSKLKLQLSRIGVRLESLGERIEDTPVGRFTETLLASVAQFDNEIRAERCKGGMEEAVSQGRWVWRPPLGYMSVRHEGKGTIAPKPGEAELIQSAFQLLSSRQKSPQVVREMLAQAGIRRSQSSFYRMIENEAYIGRIRAFGGVYEAKPPFVPLIDEVTFLRAKAALRPNNLPAAYQKQHEDFPLRGTMRCLCGRLYTASWSRGKTGERYAYYRCIRCKGRNHKQSFVESQFALKLKQFEPRDGILARLGPILERVETLRVGEQSESRERALAQLDDLRQLRDSLAIKNAQGIIPDDVAKEQMERIGKEMAQVASQIPEQREQHKIDELIQFASDYLTDLSGKWHRMSLQMKNDLLRFMFPTGVLFHPERGFGNPEDSLTERVSRVLSGRDLHLVDQAPELSKALREWLIQLCAHMGKSPKSVRPRENWSVPPLQGKIEHPDDHEAE